MSLGASLSPARTMPHFSTLVYPFLTVTTDATASALTLTAAQILGGLILRDPNGAGRTDTLPTAALLVAAIPGCQVGSSFQFDIRNTADAAETITIAAGSGGTVSGTATIAQNNTKRFLVRITAIAAGSETYTIYSIGTFVH
jgi:hypothetical protein